MLRIVAALMLALVVPVQAAVAACPDVCATALLGQEAIGDEAPQQATAIDHGDIGDQTHGHHCDKSDAQGKCCQGHSVMTHAGTQSPVVSAPGFEGAAFVARWTNFIPEEASPPPIAC